MRLDGLDSGCPILFQQRIGDAIREVAIRFMVHFDESEWQAWLQGVNDSSSATIASIHDDLERFQRALVNVTEQMIDITLQMIESLQAPLPRRRRKPVLLGEALNLLEAAIAAYGLGVFAHELHAIEVFGIMAGGDHDAPIQTLIEGGEINFLRPADANVVDIDTTIEQPAHQCRADGGARPAYVIPHYAPLWLQKLGISPPNAITDLFIQLIRDPTPNVVSLETAQLLAHFAFLILQVKFHHSWLRIAVLP